MTRTEILKARLARIDRIAETLKTDLEKIRASDLWWLTRCELDEIELNEAFEVCTKQKARP